MAEFNDELAHFVGRPSPIYHARRWSALLGGAQIYLKREDLNHTGAHKINNTIGQALLARRMGKPRVIAETGAGQHGVATATVAARFGMECIVYMGSEDVGRQAANVYRMKLLGAKVVPVESGSRTLKDALNEAMRDWVTNVENTFYIIGTVAGPHPYPMMVRDFNSVVGKECIEQMPQMTGRQPDAVIACVGGGSNAMGIFYDYIPARAGAPDRGGSRRRGPDDDAPRGEPADGNAGRAARQSNLPAAGRERPDHRDALGERRTGLPGVGPEHAWLKDSGRAEYVGATDDEALKAFHECCRIEGIIPALESSHALAYATKLAPTMRKDQILLVNLSGRGDKDLHIVSEASGLEFYCRASCREASIEYRHNHRGRSSDVPHRGALRIAAPAGSQRPDSVHLRRRSRRRPHRAADARARACRRRRDRTGRAVFGSDGRWPGDPARCRESDPQRRRAEGRRSTSSPAFARRIRPRRSC